MIRISKTLRRLRSLVWTAITILTVMAAIVVGIGKLLMPYSDRYQPQLEKWLSGQFQQPVRIESFTGEWKAFGPRISLRGLTFTGQGQAEDEIAIQQAALDIKPLSGLLPGRSFYSFHVIGADLNLERLADGRLELSGLGVNNRTGGPQTGSGLNTLTRVGELRLEDSSLSYWDELRELSVQLSGVKGRVQLDGSSIAAAFEAVIADQDEGRVVGDIKATLLLRLDDEQRLENASWHAKTRELMLDELVKGIPSHPLIPQAGWLNAELWGSWAPGQGQGMEGVLDLRESRLMSDAEELEVEHINARFEWRMQGRKTWRLDFSDFQIHEGGRSWATDRLSIERNIPANLGLWISADALHVSFPLEITQRIMAVYETPWPKNIPRRASGSISSLDLVLDRRWKLHLLRGSFDRLEAWAWDRWPDVAGLQGTVDLSEGEGAVRLSGAGVDIHWPRNFQRKLIADIPECTLNVQWGSAWQVFGRACRLENELLALSGDLRFIQSEGKPAVDINVLVNRASIGLLDAYWPRSLIKPNVADWLANGLVDGQADGRFMLRGDMDDWPFSDGSGQLEARVKFSDLDLEYYPGWPTAGQISGSAHFLGTSMEVEASVGNMAGAPVSEVRGRIPDFRNAHIDIDYRSPIMLPELVGFIDASPLLSNSELDLKQFKVDGVSEIRGRLLIPLKSGASELEVSGQLSLSSNSFEEKLTGFQLHDIRGTLEFDRDGLNASLLEGRYGTSETRLSVSADWSGPARFESEVQGEIPLAELIPESIRLGEPLLDFLSGKTPVKATFTVTPGAGDAKSEMWLSLTSDLEGISSALPAPLAKLGESRWPMTLNYPIRSARAVASLEIPERVSLVWDLMGESAEPRRAAIRLGSGAALLPGIGHLSVSGKTEQLDLDQWVTRLTERFSSRSGWGRLVLDPITLDSSELWLLGRSFPEVALKIEYADDIMLGRFDSEQIAGELRYSRSDSEVHSLAAQLDRLLLPKPMEDGVTMDTDPVRLPELHIYIKAFGYLGLELGETRIEAYPTKEGFRFASVEAHSPDFTLNARGDWLKTASGPRSDFDIVMTSESLGSLMSALNISSVLEGGQTLVRYDASWPGTPAAFALERLNGEMSFSVIDGTIVNADAGAGRMVGLMSIAALPRRLALDFRDVFGTGFIFDEAAGTVTLENGTAYTDDMVLKSTAATMEIRGSSDLEEKGFDYILSIKPGVGQALPVIGALAAGPGGAAAGLALQGLLQKSLGEAAEARYSITGSWESPAVVPIPPENQSNVKANNE